MTDEIHSLGSPIEPAESLLGREIDGFRILAQVGAGGMGEVYKAFDTRLQRPVAIKMVAEMFAADPEFMARFEREARAASSINHPNVAQIHSSGRWGRRPYYVMEYVDGASLADLIEREGRVPASKCLDYLAQACAGLEAAGEKGIIHRDVKPGNLMIDAKDRLKIVDFGLARRLTAGDARLTQTDRVVGTPSYMSPEQAMADTIDHRSDIYSLGATFYHLLAGEPPFDAATPIALMMKHVQEPLPPLDGRNPGLPPGLCRVIEKMMAKRPEDRYQTYEDLAADLRRARAGEGPTSPLLPRPAAGSRTEVTAGAGAWLGRASSSGAWFVAMLVLLAAGVLMVVGSKWARLDLVDGMRTAPPAATSPPATASGRTPAAREAEAPPPLTSPSTSAAVPAVTAPPAPPPPAFDPSVVFSLAFNTRTQAQLRHLSTAVEVFRSQGEELPASLSDLTTVMDLYPDDKRDGWGREILYVRVDRGKFRLVSAGPDGQFGGADDIVMENGHAIQGVVEFPFAPQPVAPPAPPR